VRVVQNDWIFKVLDNNCSVQILLQEYGKTVPEPSFIVKI